MEFLIAFICWSSTPDYWCESGVCVLVTWSWYADNGRTYTPHCNHKCVRCSSPDPWYILYMYTRYLLAQSQSANWLWQNLVFISSTVIWQLDNIFEDRWTRHYEWLQPVADLDLAAARCCPMHWRFFLAASGGVPSGVLLPINFPTDSKDLKTLVKGLACCSGTGRGFSYPLPTFWESAHRRGGHKVRARLPWRFSRLGKVA